MSFLHQIFNVYLGVPTALIGVVTSSLSLGFFLRDSTTFLGTCILLFSVSITDISHLALYAFYHLTEDLIQHTPSPRLTVLAITFYGRNVFEMARNWLLVVVALERLLFFLRPIDFVQLWTPAMVTAAVAVVMVSVLLVGIPSLLYQLPDVSLEAERNYRMAYTLVECFLLTILPIVSMIVLFLATRMQVKKTALKHNEICSDTDSNAKRVMGILQTIVVTFTVFMIPCFFSSVLHFYCQYYQLCTSPIMEALENGLIAVAKYFSIVVSTSNFFIYIIQSHGYRQRLIYMLRLQRFRWFRAHGDGGVERMQDTTGGVGNTERGERRDRNDRSGDDAEQ
uniref:Gpcr rhodopsin superfamily n=1 Tax=Echinococcus granulosus TaxID=6210 RepID=A0A068WNL2_ECHGR|nr:gpcr rhodopsin superfamily [Echinococcus granulosus]